MNATIQNRIVRSLVFALALAPVACGEQAPVAPSPESGARAQFAKSAAKEQHKALAELRRATARYHNIKAAIDDGYKLAEECESYPGEGQVGTVYANFGLIDGTIDTSRPEALLYEPTKNGKLKLVGVELVIWRAAWTGEHPPTFLGEPFRLEGSEFYGLHIWIWRHNPNGMFAVANPRVSCGSEP